MNKARYVRSRWWVAGSCLGAFVALFGAVFARDRDAFESPSPVEAVAPVATVVTLPSSTTTRSVRPAATTQQSPAPVQPSTQSTTTTQPHTRTRAS